MSAGDKGGVWSDVTRALSLYRALGDAQGIRLAAEMLRPLP